jgi:hypothetical protein
MDDHRLDLSGGVGRWTIVIGAGIFATTLAQSYNLDLPLRNLLVNKFQIPASRRRGHCTQSPGFS